MAVDIRKFRSKMAADSTFLVPALDPTCDEDGAEQCREILRVILDDPKIKLLIPFPVLAEQLVSGHEDYSNLPSVEFIPFELKAAHILKRIGPKAIQIVQDLPSSARQLVKYDAMIVATAKAWNADLLISNDKKVKTMSTGIGLQCYGWQHFMTSDRSYQQGALLFKPEEVE